MILYRLAKWMEERKRLKRLIAEADGDAAVYIEQKAYVERQMMQEAFPHLEKEEAGNRPAAALFALDAYGAAQPVFGLEMSGGREELDLPAALADMRREANRLADSGARDLNEPLRIEDLLAEELLRLSLIESDALHAQP